MDLSMKNGTFLTHPPVNDPGTITESGYENHGNMEAFSSSVMQNTSESAPVEEITVNVDPTIFDFDDTPATPVVPYVSSAVHKYKVEKNVTFTPSQTMSAVSDQPSGSVGVGVISANQTTSWNSSPVSQYPCGINRESQFLHPPPEGLFPGQVSNWETSASHSYQHFDQSQCLIPLPEATPENQFGWENTPNLSHTIYHVSPSVYTPPNVGYNNITPVETPTFFQIPQNEPPKLVCKICSSWTTSIPELCSHFTKHLAQNALKQSPPFEGLGKLLEASNTQWFHMDYCMIYLRTISPTLVPAKPYECPVCPKNYLHFSSLYQHIVNKHANQHKFTCDICQIVFSSNARLQVHKRRHFRRNQLQWGCGGCKVYFSTKYSLDEHIKRNCKKNMAVPSSASTSLDTNQV